MLTCLKINCDFQVSDANFLKMHEHLAHSQLPKTAVEDLIGQLEEQLRDVTVSDIVLKLGPKQPNVDLVPEIFSAPDDSEVKTEPPSASKSPPLKRVKPTADLRKVATKPQLFSNARLKAGNIHQVFW